jgi:hypothetical protein
VSKFDNDHFEWLELRAEELIDLAEDDGESLTFDEALEQARDELMNP